MSEKKYNVLDVLAASSAAMRFNNGYERQSCIWVNDDTTLKIEKVANSDLIDLIIDKDRKRIYSINGKVHEIDHIENFSLIDEDRTQAEKIIKYYRKLLFAIIDKADWTSKKIWNIIESKEVTRYDLNYMAWLPMQYKKDCRIDVVKDLIETLTPEHLANPLDRVRKLSCEIIDCFKIYGNWIILSIVDNKLTYWVKRKPIDLGNKFITSAIVKEFHDDFLCDGTVVTRLCRVNLRK